MNGSAGWGRIVPSLPAGPGRPAITWACLLVRRSARGDLWWCSVDPSCVSNLGKTVVTPQNQLFSVLRTGTGDLDLASAGNLTQWSPYGVYTAGTQAADVATGFNQPRGLFNGSVLGAGGADYEVLSTSQYQAWYPEHGGNLDIAVGGDVVGDQWAETDK